MLRHFNCRGERDILTSGVAALHVENVCVQEYIQTPYAKRAHTLKYLSPLIVKYHTWRYLLFLLQLTSASLFYLTPTCKEAQPPCSTIFFQDAR
jgi:hypothetical protein